MNDKRSKTAREFYPAALTIAGNDPSGGAGIAADLRTFNAFGVYGTCVITALTAQNPKTVSAVTIEADSVVAGEISSVMDACPLSFAKTGMLGSGSIVKTVADAIRKYNLQVICDPVMISTSGKSLLAADAVDILKNELLPQTAWITPNIPEAEHLADCRISSENDMCECALKLHKRYNASIILKGGHNLQSDEATDIVCRAGKLYRLISPAIDTPPYASHGTGCTFSAALTAGLVLKYPWKQALCEAKSFVFGSLAQSVELANGLHAMYPPTEDCYNQIRLEEIKTI